MIPKQKVHKKTHFEFFNNMITFYSLDFNLMDIDSQDENDFLTTTIINKGILIIFRWY